MKKVKLLVTFLSLMLAITSCSNRPQVNQLPSDTDYTQSKILISYFTWADNTIVEDPDSVDVDVSTSASVLAPGNAEIVATFIDSYIDADMFSIQVDDLYSSDYDECLNRASIEKAQNARPTLKTHVENMEQYEIVFLGFPNWWYTIPMAIHSFLEEYDFSGKTIIPFCVHGTGGLASTIQDIQKSLDDDVVFITNAFHVYRPNTKGCSPDVKDWLIELGFENIQ